MFRDSKTAFGQPGTTTFGGFGATAAPGVTPFGTPGMANAGGATAFGKPAVAPGQPVFGSTPTTSLFGGTATGNPGGAAVPQGGSLFGGAGAGTTFGLGHTTQSAFGGFSSATTAPNIFGTATGAAGTGAAGGGGLFGVVASTSTAPVGGQQVSTSNAVVPFGAAQKPATAFGTLGGFGQTATAPQQTGGSLFGNTSGGMFSTGFGSTAGTATGAGTPVKFSPLMGTDTMVKNGVQQTISTRHQCITCMKEYESKSLEELRMEDYAAGRRGGGVAVTVPGATNSLAPAFGATAGVFGAGAGGTTAGSLFGKPTTGATPTGGFSAVTTSANSGFSFTVPGSNIFGGANANKPFGAAAPQPSTLFGGGTTTNAFGAQSMGFGGFGQQNQSIGLFGQTKTPFGTTGTTGLTFGAGTAQNPAATAQPAQGTSLFGTPKSATATNTFGTPNAFGVPTSTAPPAFGSAFGAAGAGTSGGTTSVFGQPFKPATTSAFPFGQTTQANAGLGTGLNLGQPSLFGNTAVKPGGTGVGGLGGGVLFGGATSGTSGGGIFGGGATAGTTLGGGTTFGAGNTSMGLGTGGSSLFGGGGTLGGLGSSLGGGTQLGQNILGGNTGAGLLGSGGTLGGGSNAVQWGAGGSGGLGLSLGSQSGGGLLGSSGNASFLGNAQFCSGGLGGSGSMGLGSLSGPAGSTAGTGGSQHVISVSTLPFGDSRLFRDLLPTSSKLDDVLKTTNPAAQKALMAGSQFKVSPHGGNSGTKVKVKPLGASALSKRSLFDGLEEEDASLLTVFSPRTGSKRLTLKSKPPGSSNSTDSPPSTSQNSVSTPVVAPSNGPTLSLRARLAGSSSLWEKDNSRQSVEGGGQWLRKPTPSAKELTKSGSSSQLQNSNHHDSPNVNLNESSSDLENTIADLRTRLDSSGSTPIGRPPHRKKDVDLPIEIRSRHSVDPVEDGVDEVDQEVSLTIELNNSREKGGEDSRREEEDDAEPHPTGIILRRSGYYTIPSLDELATLIEEIEDSNGEKRVSVIVKNFTVGREGYGNVFFPDSFDVANLNLDEIVHFRHKEIVVYPGDGDDDDSGEELSSGRGLGGTSIKPDTSRKPPIGSELNRKAQVTLDRVWPIDKVTRDPVTDPDRLAAMNYEGKLQRVCAQMRTRFVEYRPQTGSWVFKVDHFSKYGLSDSDDDDCPPFLPAVGAAGSNVATAPGATAVANGTVGKKITRLPLQPQENGMFSCPGDEQMDQSMAEHASVDISRVDGWPSDGSLHSQGKRFSGVNAGQDVHENGFQDGGVGNAIALSPTAQMAQQLGTSTHKIQLMKGSFFGDDGDEGGSEYVERRPSQSLLAKSRDLNKQEENIGPKSSGDIFRTRFTCRDPTILSRVHSERGLVKEFSQSPYSRPLGPPSTISSSSASQFLLPLQESPPPQPVPASIPSKASSTSSRPSLFPPHPLVLHSKVAVLRHRGRHMKCSDLVQSLLPKLDNPSLLLADLGLFLGRTFRSGWGPGMKLSALTSAKVASDGSTMPSKLFSALTPLSNGRTNSDFTNVVVQQLHLLGGTQDSRTFQSWIEPHLWVQLEHSLIVNDEELTEYEANKDPSTELEPDLSGPCPRFAPRSGKDIIHAHHDLSHSTSEDGFDREDPNFQLSSYACLVWDLCCALWGNLPELEDDQGEEVIGINHKISMARRRALSEWLQQAADQTAKGQGKKGTGGNLDETHTGSIFNLLTRRRLLEACETAQKKGDHFLALTLASGGWNCRAQLRKQLSAWSHVGVDDFIGEGRMKLFALKSGTPLLPTVSFRHATIDCCRGLDWKRAFALHLWYVCSPVCSITDALTEYESAFIDDQSNKDNTDEGKESLDRNSLYAPPPAPHYMEAEQIQHKMEIGVSGKLPYYDLCFHLLKLYSCRSHSLEALLNTSTHTPDPLDVRLSWFRALLCYHLRGEEDKDMIQFLRPKAGIQWQLPTMGLRLSCFYIQEDLGSWLLCESLNALGYSHLSTEALASLHQGMAALLESHGLWHWALFPLLHLGNPKRRKASVLAMLGRHVRLVGVGMMPEEEAIYLQREHFITYHLQIPSSWVYQAKAKLAASLHRHGDTAWCLAKAGLWNECHKVILKHIAADAVINENLNYLRDLLAQLAPEERSRTISGWSCGGQVFWDYLEVISEIETLMNIREKGTKSGVDVCTNEGYCLERLQPKLSSLCSRLIDLPCTSAKERLCQSEISKRIAHVVRALVLTSNGDSSVATPSASRVLAYLVTQLPMPPDYLLQELRHLVEVYLDELTSNEEEGEGSNVYYKG